MKSGLYLGVDGCTGGWIAAVLVSGELRLERYDSIKAIIRQYPTFDAFLIDMAIGLRSSPDQMRPDGFARKELGVRASTIFSVPSRAAVYANGEDSQKAANLRELGKSLSKQTVNIIPKIREVDEFLDAYPQYKNRILESHPELDFSRLNGSVLLSRKKGAAGIEEREAILAKYLPSLPDIRDAAKKLNCNPDDVVDAICLAVTAAFKARGMCETMPERPESDERGLRMQMTVPIYNAGGCFPLQ